MKTLEKAGIAASAIHGNKSQNHRERTLAQFRSGEIRTLVATDIAARGIDVDGISHVINFDLPNVPETYVHRIGRTARAGAEGTAISLVAGGEELSYLRDIERLIKVTLSREDHRTDAGRRDAGRPRRSNDRAGRAARASARKAQGMVRDVTLTDDAATKGMPTDATIAPASMATEGPAKVGTVTEGMLTDVPVVARRSRRGLAANGPVVRRILPQPSARNSVPRIAPASPMGYKAWPFYAARVGRWANRPANPIRTSRPRPGEIHG